MKSIPHVRIADSTGTQLWSGSLHAFGRVNGREVLSDVLSQFRASPEPAIVGGGAAEAFSVAIVGAR